MKTKNKLRVNGFKFHFLVLLIFIGIVTWSCSNDDAVLESTGVDTRMEGRDLVLIFHDNPLTDMAYSSEELSALTYDPSVEDFFYSSYKAEILIWTQQKPLKVEVFKADTKELVTFFETSTRDDRPDLSSYKEGYGYSTSWKFLSGEIGVPVGESQLYNIKVTYNDQGIGGFQTSSTREVQFTINHIEDDSISILNE